MTYDMIIYNCSKGTNPSTKSKRCMWFSIVPEEYNKKKKNEVDKNEKI
jgi:hypothetical protein